MHTHTHTPTYIWRTSKCLLPDETTSIATFSAQDVLCILFFFKHILRNPNLISPPTAEIVCVFLTRWTGRGVNYTLAEIENRNPDLHVFHQNLVNHKIYWMYYISEAW